MNETNIICPPTGQVTVWVEWTGEHGERRREKITAEVTIPGALLIRVNGCQAAIIDESFSGRAMGIPHDKQAW